ncbi:MAG: hypothetical protein J5752_03900 [Clostridiales bacterium]|nr:hypothetical protein [Clostridiales bacterium]
MTDVYSEKPSYRGNADFGAPSYSIDELDPIRLELIRKEKTARRNKIIRIAVILSVLVLSFITYLYVTKVFIPDMKRKEDYRRLVNGKVKVDEVIIFGEYEWENTWRVKRMEGSKILLVHVKGVGLGSQDEINYTSPSVVADWLRNDYYEVAFGSKDKAIIVDGENGRVFYNTEDLKISYSLGPNGVVSRKVFPYIWIDTDKASK